MFRPKCILIILLLVVNLHKHLFTGQCVRKHCSVQWSVTHSASLLWVSVTHSASPLSWGSRSPCIERSEGSRDALPSSHHVEDGVIRPRSGKFPGPGISLPHPWNIVFPPQEAKSLPGRDSPSVPEAEPLNFQLSHLGWPLQNPGQQQLGAPVPWARAGACLCLKVCIFCPSRISQSFRFLKLLP